MDDVYVVTARVTSPDGRSDESIGAVTLGKLQGDALANALMKCETKAKRRATLSLVGLSLLDETEVETIPNARVEPMPRAALPTRAESVVSPFEPVSESVTEEADPGVAEEVVIPPEIRAAGAEALDAFVMIRKSLWGAKTLEDLAKEWGAVNVYLKSAGLPAVVGQQVGAVKDAMKAKLSGQLTAF